MFQSYEQIAKIIQENIREMSHVRVKMIFRYIIGWLMLPISFFVPFIIWIEPRLIAMLLPTPASQTETIVRAVAFIVLFVGVIFFIIFLLKTPGKFRHQYQRLIVKEMVKQLFETYEFPGGEPFGKLKWVYNSTGKVSNYRMHRSGLFVIKKGDKVSGHDAISGIIGYTKFHLSTLKLFKRVDRKHDERSHLKYPNRKDNYKRKYKGILFLADFNKHFKGHTLLRDRHIRSFTHLKRYIWLRFNSVITGKHLPRIKMENPDFNHYFATRTSDEVEARYILTPNFMEKLMHFRKKRRNPIDISFQYSYISMALSSKKSFFKPSIFRRMKHGQVKEVYEDLVFFFSIINDLDLNLRIWTKD